jgi:signal transduction histidine kinase
MVDSLKGKAKSDSSKEMEESSGTFTFGVDASLLFQLGEQLVARRSIALAELIKNSYDADATLVTVLLENVKTPGGSIIIQDDGLGMTFEDVRDHWMRVGTTDKIDRPLSPVFGRSRTGAKGVGRFAVRKLGERLTLHSVAQRKDKLKEEVTVKFDWSKGFAPGQELTEIPVSYTRRIVSNDTPVGVILHIEAVREAWTKDDISSLRGDLLDLVSPFPPEPVEEDVKAKGHRGKKRDPGFNFALEVPEFPEYTGNLSTDFLRKAAWGKLVGTTDSEGNPTYHLDISVTDENLEFIPRDEKFEKLPNSKFEIYLLIYRADYFEDIDIGVRDAQRMGRRHGGMRVYLDGFRVFPYGDPGDDWLGLDNIRARRTPSLLDPTAELAQMENELPGRPSLLTPGNNQLYGAVQLSRLRQPAIEVNISRERLVENEAFYELRRFVLVGIHWLTLQYARVLYNERESGAGPRRYTASKILDDVQEQVRSLEGRSAAAQTEGLRKVGEKIDLAKRTAEAEEQARISELSLLRVLASAGTTVAVMNHQLRSVADGAREIHHDLKKLERNIDSKAQQRFGEVLTQMQLWRESMEGQVSLIELLLSSDARYKRQRLVLRNHVARVEKSFSLYMREHHIKFTNKVPANIRTPLLYEAELGAILFNVMSNALKAVVRTEEREIAIEASQENQKLIVRVLDTGIGIEPNRREIVFRAFETTSTPDPILGAGTGLGLKVVRDILTPYRGVARFIDTQLPWSTCLEITLPEQ